MLVQEKIFLKVAAGCVLTIWLMLLTGCYSCYDTASGCYGRYSYRNDLWMNTGAPVYYNNFDDFYDNDDNDDASDSLPNQNDQTLQPVIENSLPNQNNQPLRRID